MLVTGEASEAGLSHVRGSAAGAPVDGKRARRCRGSRDPRRDQETAEASGDARKVPHLATCGCCASAASGAYSATVPCPPAKRNGVEPSLLTPATSAACPG